jgi:hypothetical protein
MLTNEFVQRGDGERSYGAMLDPVTGERSSKLGRLRFVRRDPDGGKQANGLAPQAPAREREHAGRGGVEPLDVVDGEKHGCCPGEVAQAISERGRHGPLVGRRAIRLLEQQRDLECSSLRRREVRQQRRDVVVEQIGQARERQLDLATTRVRRKNADAPFPCALDALLPQPRLADAGLAFEEERARAFASAS